MDFAPWPYFEEDEIQAAVSVLKSGKVNQWTGREVVLFEDEFAEYTGNQYGVALANGSLALDLALGALGVGKGDEVIVTPRSFIASASCVALKSAVPIFVDVDPISQNITADNIEAAITRKTKAVIAVHLAGWPCEMDKISDVCQQYGVLLIEDCAQAHGASFKGRKLGSYGDCAVFSFCQDKIMTTAGEGGMLVTNDNKIRDSVWSFKDHGKDFKESNISKLDSKFKWFVKSFGSNCRMTEIQAAVGRVMLKKLDKWVEKRREYAGMFNQAFSDLPGLRTTIPSNDVYHSYYKYYVFIEPKALKGNANSMNILQTLNDNGVPCSSGICPEIYLERAFKRYPHRLAGLKNESQTDRLPYARFLGENSMMFMVHPTLTEESIHYVIDQVKTVFKKALR